MIHHRSFTNLPPSKERYAAKLTNWPQFCAPKVLCTSVKVNWGCKMSNNVAVNARSSPPTWVMMSAGRGASPVVGFL